MMEVKNKMMIFLILILQINFLSGCLGTYNNYHDSNKHQFKYHIVNLVSSYLGFGG